MRRLGLGGVLGPALFTVTTIVCSAMRPGYEHLHDFISELGATGTPYAGLMNWAGFIPSGFLVAAFSVAAIALLRWGVVSRIAGSLTGLFGLGVVLAGIFPCDPGCPQPAISRSGAIHDQVSGLAFTAVILGIGLWAPAFRAIPSFRSLWTYTAASSAAALIFLVLLIASFESRAFTGLWQRLFLATVFTWLGVVGWRIVRRCRPETR